MLGNAITISAALSLSGVSTMTGGGGDKNKNASKLGGNVRTCFGSGNHRVTESL